MSFAEFIYKKSKIHDSFLDFLDEDISCDESYQNIILLLKEQKIAEDLDELKNFLSFITNISNNHHRSQLFYKKIEKILSYLSNTIKQMISIKELIDIFGSNKRILLFLIKTKILILDDNFINFYKNLKSKIISYGIYFYIELNPILKQSSEQHFKDLEFYKEQILLDNPDFFINFEEKRDTGENDSYICSLIRNDSIVEFITYVNRTNLSINNEMINPSIFETNSLLNEKVVTLIQYAVFFGSIQIFNYLRMNGVELSNSLWNFAIHGRNPEIIHYLEENKINPIDKTFQKCFETSIKCHHNEISNYIFNNLITTNEEYSCFKELMIQFGISYYNWSLIPIDFDYKNFCNFIFCLLLRSNYKTFANFILDKKEIDINKVVQIILKNQYLTKFYNLKNFDGIHIFFIFKYNSYFYNFNDI